MKLICPECRRENEPERIYCHDCGARLDRSALAKEKPKEEDPKDTQRRLRTMLDPQRAKLRRQFFQGSKLVLGALALAAVVQMLRAPELPAQPELSELPAQINLDLENAVMDPRSAPLRYTEEQVNAYLNYALKGKQAALGKYLKFERAFVGLEEGVCRFTTERSLFGYSVFTAVTLAPKLENGDITAKMLGGSVGRLPVHPAMMRYGAALFGDVRAALERDCKSIAKLGSLELQPKLAVFARKQP